jgi:NADPH:quinone reductase-like Zn-dependent oxidoreductase
MPTIPKTMRAAAIDRFGGPEVLTIHTLPVPLCDSREVLIALDTAGVGSWDAEMRAGWVPAGKPRFPWVLGTDGAGVVAAVGSRIRRLKVGDRVYSYSFDNPKGGFYAEYVAVDSEGVGLLPRRLDVVQGGAGAVTGLTALQGIDEHLGVRRGETVLIFGATGAVGTLAVQFADRKKAHVIGTASGRAAAALVEKLGAHVTFDARRPADLERLPELAPDGIDAVLATAGGDALERCLDLVKRGGRVAFPNGVEPPPKRRRTLELHAYDAEASRREWERLARAATEAKLKVPIAASFPLAQAAKAHARIEKGHVVGRIALRIRRS